MDAVPNHFETLLSQAGEYAETRAKLLKLKVADKTSETVSDAASALVVGIFLIFFVVLLSFGLSFLLGELLGKTYYGFFAMAGFYAICALIFKANKKRFIKTPVSNFIIAKFLNSNK